MQQITIEKQKFEMLLTSIYIGQYLYEDDKFANYIFREFNLKIMVSHNSSVMIID